jgi:hypothetical protein
MCGLEYVLDKKVFTMVSFHVFAQELDFDAMLMKHVTKQVNDKEGTSNHSSHELNSA